VRLTTYHHPVPLSRNLGTLTSWNPLGPSEPVTGLLYLYLLTTWCRVLLEKLTGLQLLKKFSVFYGTRRFITALTSVRHLSLSWANPIQSTYPHPTSFTFIYIYVWGHGCFYTVFLVASCPCCFTLQISRQSSSFKHRTHRSMSLGSKFMFYQ